MAVNIDLLLLLIFGILLSILLIVNKKRVQFQKIIFPLLYVVMYRTKIGLNLMDRVANKFRKIVKYADYIIIGTGFLGMFLIVLLLVQGLFRFLVLKQEAPIAILLPGVEVSGFVISFFHWIIAIFVLAAVHEFSHGLLARAHNIKVKSSGFAIFGVLLPLLPAAFVEPDEQILKKRDKKTQLSVFAAGSFANVITAIIFILIWFSFGSFVTTQIIDDSGVKIVGLSEDYPASKTGLSLDEEIISVNNQNIRNVNGFINKMSEVKPNQEITIQTNLNSYALTTREHPCVNDPECIKENPDRKNFGFIGINVTNSRFGIYPILVWITQLFWWIGILNFAVGLFNLLPAGPIDGGRMFYLAVLHFLKDEEKSRKVWLFVGFALLIIIVVSLTPQFYNLIVKPILNLFNNLS